MTEWIEEAFREHSKPLRRVPEPEASGIVRQLMAHFVDGNPRVWWLALRHGHTTYSSVDNSFEAIAPESDHTIWFIPETDEFPLPVFDLSPVDVDFIRANCPLFEYYVADKHGNWIVIENDHDEFIVSCQPPRKEKVDLESPSS